MKQNIKRVLMASFMIFGCFSQNPVLAEGADEQIDEKIAYLTYDDGPTTGITEELLDILKKEGVKATFFVVGKEIIDKEHILKRMHDEGHTIGLHTYSHDYKKVYSSPQIFIDEMKQTQETINKALGEEVVANFIRFPGGSAGKLTPEFYDIIKANGYTIFDWNVSIEDGINPRYSPYELLENAKKPLDKQTVRIILAHCNLTNKNTCIATPQIIAYYKGLGYTFDTITNDTPEYYFKYRQPTEQKQTTTQQFRL
ncbi:MAG: hypothetical protein ATN36_01220 [Epulopiscium sp. Nele67-Bin005]|nr:MAG: hypothetical protein ATN36_01220 [Epulopiscium sp. Nele67-Bin005]